MDLIWIGVIASICFTLHDLRGSLFVESTNGGCPTTTVEYGGRCIYHSKDAFALVTAEDKDICSVLVDDPAYDAYLVSVQTLQELHFFWSMASRPTAQAQYIGLLYDGSQWGWQDGSAMDETSLMWASGAPDTLQTDCCVQFLGATKGAGFYTSDGTAEYPVTCEAIPKDASIESENCDWFPLLDKNLENPDKLVVSDYSLTECMAKCRTEDCASMEWQGGTSECRLNTIHTTEPDVVLLGEAGVLTYDLYCWDESFGPLLYEYGRTKDNISLSASSEFDSASNATSAVLEWGSSWRSAENQHQWLQIDVGALAKIEKVELFGGYVTNCYVTSFYIAASNFSTFWMIYNDNNGMNKLLQGVASQTDSIKHFLDPPIVARYVRIIPVTQSTYNCLKLELYGTLLPDTPTDEFAGNFPLGLESGAVESNQMSASSFESSTEYFFPPWQARLNNNVTAMIGYEHLYWESPVDSWIQVDLITPHLVSAVATQGAGEAQPHFISTFQVSFALDTILDLTPITDFEGNEMVFLGNIDPHSTHLTTFNEILEARWFRLTVVDVSTKSALRMELYGRPKVIDAPHIPKDSVEDLSEGTCSCELDSDTDDTTNKVCLSETSVLNITFRSLYLVHGFEIQWESTVNTESLELDPAVEILSAKSRNWLKVNIGKLEETEQFTTAYMFGRMQKAMGITVNVSSVNGSTCARVSVAGYKAKACPPGFVQFHSKCYTIVEGSYNLMEGSEWQNSSLELCKQYSWNGTGRIATVTSMEENFAIWNLMSRSKKTYIGHIARNLTQMSDFDWTHYETEQAATWTFWQTGYPASGDVAVRCTALESSPYWQEVSCEAALMIACEMDVSYAPAPETCANAEWESYLFHYPTTSLFEEDSSLDGLSLWHYLSLCQDGSIASNCSSMYYSTATGKVYFSAYSTKNVTLVLTNSISYDFFEFSQQKDDCSEPLVWNNYPVQVSVDASSSKTAHHGVVYAELTNEISIWKPYFESLKYEFVQVDFHVIARVTKVVLRGGALAENCWVKTYMLMYTNDTRWWEVYKYETGEIMEFRGTSGRYFLHQIYLDRPILARFVRLVPTTVSGSSCVRFELFGSFIAKLHNPGCTTLLKASGLYNTATLKLSSVEVNGQPRVHVHRSYFTGLHVITLDSELCQSDLSGRFLPHTATGAADLLYFMDHAGNETLGVSSYQLQSSTAVLQYFASHGLARYTASLGIYWVYSFITSRQEPSIIRDVAAAQSTGPVLLSHVWHGKKTPGLDVSVKDFPETLVNWPMNCMTQFQDIAGDARNFSNAGASPVKFKYETGIWHHGYAYFDGTAWLKADINHTVVLQDSFSISVAVSPEQSGPLFELISESEGRIIRLWIDDINEIYFETELLTVKTTIIKDEAIINDNIWNFLTLTYNARLQLLRVFTNGKVAAHRYVDLSDFMSLGNHSSIHVGATHLSDLFFKGKIACLEFYDVVLSASDVQKTLHKCRGNTDQFQNLGYVSDSFPEGPLGIITRSLTPSQIKVSSTRGTYFKDDLALYSIEHKGHSSYGGWSPSSFGTAVNYEFVQIDLGLLHAITAIVLKGTPFNDIFHATGFVLEHAEQLQNWHLITDSDGSNKTFTGNFDPHYALRISLVEYNIQARHIRLWPRGSRVCLQTEILGHPVDDKVLLQLEHSTGSEPNCSYAVVLNDFNAYVDILHYWIVIDFRGVFYISSIHVNITGDILNTSSTIEVETRLEHDNWKTIPEIVFQRSITYGNTSYVRHYFAPVIRTKYLRIHINSNHCCSPIFTIHGSKAPACPPGSTRYGSKCVYPVLSGKTSSSHAHVLADSICETFSWYSLSNFGIIASRMKMAMYIGLIKSIGFTAAWVSMQHSTSEQTAYWSDGTSVEGGLWATNYPQSGSPALLGTSALKSYSDTTAVGLICETDAEDSVINSWNIVKEDSIYVHTTGNGMLKLYIDGMYQDQRLDAWWELPLISKASWNISVVAVEIHGNGNEDPMMLSLISGNLKFTYETEADVSPDGIGAAINDIGSDSSWKCSSAFEKLWTFPQFNDSHWNDSIILGNYSSGPSLINEFTNLTVEPQWISVNGVTPSDVLYCRKTIDQSTENVWLSEECELRWLYVNGRCAPNRYQAVNHAESATECMNLCLTNLSMTCGSVDYVDNAQPSCFYREERRVELSHDFIDVASCHYFETWCSDVDDNLIWTLYNQGLASMSATTSYSTNIPEYGILNAPSYWRSSSLSYLQYLQVDLEVYVNITAITTKSPGSSDSFRLFYKNPETGLNVPVPDRNGNAKVFKSNWNMYDYYTELLEKPLITNLIRINPQSWLSGYIAIKFDVHGTILPDKDYPNSLIMRTGLGMESRNIGATQIKSSVPDARNAHRHTARLNYDHTNLQQGCWIAQADPFLEINLLISHTITEIAFQKCTTITYYVTHVRIQHTSDNINWNTITDTVTGDPVVFNAIIFSGETSSILLPNVTDAKSIRIEVVNYVSSKGLRLELYGHPNDCDKISDPDEIENVTVNGVILNEIPALIATDELQEEPYCVDPNLGTIEIQVELSYLHMLTSIEFLSGATVTSFELSYTNDPTKWNTYQDAPNETLSTQNTHVQFSYALKAYMVRITASISESHSCIQFQLHGCKIPDVCPPQFIEHDGRCYHRSNFKGNYEDILDYCSSTAWKGGGYPAMPKDYSQLEFLLALENPYYASRTTVYIGLRSVDGNLTWADGLHVMYEEALPWASTPTTECTAIGVSVESLDPTPCTTGHYLICETRANYGRKTKSTISWMSRRAMVPTLSWGFHLYGSPQVLDCMILCLQTVDCKSFVHTQTSGYCTLATTTFPAGIIEYTNTQYYHYFEYHVKDICETELLAEATDIIGSSYFDETTRPELVIYNNSYYLPGRLTYWRPADADNLEPWIQASFATPVEIQRVTYTGTVASHYVSIHLAYSTDGLRFSYHYTDFPSTSIRYVTGSGMQRGTSEVTSLLQYSIVATHIKVFIGYSSGQLGLRLSLYGCFKPNITFTDEAQPLGMKSGKIKDSQLSSYDMIVYPDGTWNSPYASRLNQERTGIDLAAWSPRTTTDTTYSFLQIDFYNAHTITGIIIEGEGSSYVTLYDVHYSTDRLNWIDTREDGSTMSYPGYRNAMHQFMSPNITTISLRLYPKGYSNMIAVRMELFGYPQDCLIVNPVNQSVEVSCNVDLAEILVTTKFEENHLVTSIILRGSSEFYPQIMQDVFQFSNVSGEIYEIPTQIAAYSMDSTEWKISLTELPEVMNFSLTVTNVTECLTVDVLACKLPGCPLGYANSKGVCYFYYDTELDGQLLGRPFNETQVKCNSTTWAGKHASVVLPDDLETLFLLKSFVIGSAVKHFIDLVYDDTRSEWISQNNMALEFSHWGIASQDADMGHCVVSMNGIWKSHPCDQGTQFCQVQSSDEDTVRFQWIHLGLVTVSTGTSYQSVYQLHVSRCLQLCETGDRCLSVQYVVSTNMCYLHDENRYSGIGLSSGSDYYYEKLEIGSCYKDLFESVGYSISASSELDQNHNALQSTNGSISYWQPLTASVDEWIEVQFDTRVALYGLMIIGDHNVGSGARLKTFKFQYTTDSVIWESVLNSIDGTEVFESFAGNYGLSHFLFHDGVFAKVFKLLPLSWNINIALQWKFYGCLKPVLFQSCATDETEIQVQWKCLGDWDVILWHNQHSDLFNTTWNDYKDGFKSNSTEEFYMGNTAVSHQTANAFHNMRVDLWLKDGTYFYSEFTGFKLELEAFYHALEVSNFTQGTAETGGLVDVHSNMAFQTYDNGDINGCAVQKGGGWWYNDCNGTSLTSYSISWNSSEVDDLLIETVIMRMKPDLKLNKLNLAIKKPTSSSSKAAVELGPDLVVDGDPDSDISTGKCFKTKQETNPFIIIDLRALKRIQEIKVIAPSDFAGVSLQDFSIRYLNEGLNTSHDISTYVLCDHFPGIAQPGEHVMLNCPMAVYTQYVAVQIHGTDKTLVLCEMEVYAEPLSQNLDETCYGDDDCGITFAVCLPVNPAAQDLHFTCQCSTGYTPIDNICKAYVDILFNFSLPHDVGVMRGRDINITAQILIENNDTTPFAFSSTGVNFNISMYLSNTEDIEQMASHLDSLKTLPFNYLQNNLYKTGLRGKEALESNINFTVDILTSQCPMITYLCLKLDAGANATYIDKDISNNCVCIDISDNKVCRPDADVMFRNLTYEKPLEIIRDTPGPYIFHTVLEANHLYSDIFEADLDTINFKLTYAFFPEGALPAIAVLNGSSAGVIEPNMTDAQSGLLGGSTTSQTLSINILVDYLECVNMSQFCLFVADDLSSSYTEIDWSNNMFCLEIFLYKECRPVIEISVGDIAFPSQIIRGYNSTAVLSFSIHDHDVLLPVSILDKEDKNFNVTLYLATTSDAATFSDNNYGEYEVEISLEQQQSKILAGSNLTFHGIVTVYVSRESCGSIEFICLQIQPGQSSSYTQPKNTATVICFEALLGLNCDGLPAKDVNVILNPPIAGVGVEAVFMVSWTEGTDLKFTIDYGDGQNSFQWHWQTNGHIKSYGSHSVDASNTYNYIGNYTMPLTLGNQLGDQFFQFNTVVEATLPNYINVTSTYYPSAVPVDFTIFMTHINELDTGTVHMTCVVTWGDGNSTKEKVSVDSLSRLRYTYTEDLPNVTAKLNCSNHVSYITYETFVILREDIRELHIIQQKRASATFLPTLFNVTMVNGSHVVLEVDFGDGTFESFNNSVIETFSIVWVIEHIYELPANYTVTVMAINEHFQNTTTLLEPVILQNPVRDTSLTGETNIKVPDGLATFTLALMNTDNLPTSVVCSWMLNGALVLRAAADLLEVGQDELFNYQFKRLDCGPINISVMCANLVSSSTSGFNFNVYEEIAGIQIISQPGAMVNETVTTIVTLTNGSGVIFEVDFGNGVNLIDQHIKLYAVDNPTEFQHNYSSTGNYTVTVRGRNPVSNEDITHDIAVQNILSDIVLSANESVLWPPGLVHFNISKHNNVTYNNVHCFWDYGQNNTDYLYIDELFEENWHISTFTKAFIGLAEIKLNCSNLVSSVSLNITVDIIFDRVTLDSLNTSGWVWWTNTSTAMLTIERFGTNSCFEWDMGDGTKYMYGTPWCEANATKLGLKLNMLAYDVSILVVNHIYETWNEYPVTVYAYNHVSNDTNTTISVVKDWYCNKPVIEFSENYTDIANPIQFMRSVNFVISPTLVRVDCMKSLNRSESTLKVFHRDNPNTPVHEEILTKDIQFHHPPLLLAYGKYAIEIFMSMFEVSYVNTTVVLQIEIIPTPLVIKIDHNPLEQKFFGEVLYLKATDYSFDPDILQNEEQEIEFDWACRRIDEDFPVDSSGNILPAGPADETILDEALFRGCFAGGPGKVAVGQSEYTLDTSLMLPNISYVIHLHGYKDTRTAFAEKELELGSAAAPEVTVSCRENCAYKKRVSGRLVIDSECHNYCETKFGTLQYLWELQWIDELTGENISYSNLKTNMTAIGNDKSSIFILPFTMKSGVWHTLTLNTWTPLSYVKKTQYHFLVNLPPYGGTCTLDPDEGKAKETLFTTKCINWKEFKPDGADVLKYEYRISSKGSTRNFLTYFGDNGDSSPTVLPVGNVDLDYFNEYQLYIIDSIGDYYIYIQDVKVYPDDKPQSVVSLEILSSLEDKNSDLGRAVAAGDNSKVATTLFSMLSVLNIPLDDESGNNDTLSESEVLKLKTTARSTTMALAFNIPVQVVDSLEQVNAVVRSALHNRQEVDVPLIDAGVDKIESLSEFFVLERNKTYHEKKIQIAKDLTGSTIKVLLGGDYLLHQSASNFSGNSTQASSINQTERVNNTVRYQVGIAMNRSMGVIDTLSGALLDDKNVGDPDDVIEFDELSLMVSKNTAEKLDNQTVSTKQGNLKMPSMTDAFPNSDGSCIDNTVLFSFVNPFILDESADLVNTAVLTLGLYDCSIPGNRTKRSISTGNPSFDVEVASRQEPIHVNETVDDSTQMLIHHLNLSTSSHKPIVLSVFPRENSSLEVYVAFHPEIDPTDYYDKFQVPMIDKFENENGTDVDLYELQHTIYLTLENITEQNKTALYIGIVDTGCLEGKSCEDEPNMVYSYILAEVECREWDSENQVWTSEFCEVLPGSLPSKPKFKSNLFGSMGAGLFVGPNLIDFKNVFDNLDQKLADNAAVVGTVIGLIILYIPFVILCRIFDKRDKKKWMILPLADNNENDPFCYEVHVYTGIKRYSETDSNVQMVLAGTHSDTGIRRVCDGERKNFNRAGVDSFLLKTNVSLGIPVTLKIWHDNSGQGSKAGWFLSKVVVVDLQTSDWYLFKCDNWLSAAEGDGSIERIVHSYKDETDQDSQVLLQSNIQKKLFDDHLWLSVGYRSTRSRFTRVQRLSVCLAILFLTMVSNAMWFGTGDAESKQVAFTFGPISLTVYQLYTSIMSSLIVVPPIVAITMLFSKSAPKQDSNIAKGALQRDDSRQKKQKRKLPYWGVYIAFGLIVLSVTAGAFFTILYAFEWGKAKSEEWLVTFILSFLESVLLIQPIKVIIVAVLLSLLFKKDTDISDFEDTVGSGLVQPKKELQPVNTDFLKASKIQLTEDEIDAAKKRQELETKSRTLVREVAWQIIFLAILLWVIVGNQDHNVFYQNTNLWNMFLSSISNVEKKNDTWAWMRNDILPEMYLIETYTEAPMTAYDEKFLKNGYAYRLGPPRLRQIRVTEEDCEIPGNLNMYIKHCTTEFQSKYEETRDFTIDWKGPLNISDADDASPLELSYIFNTKSETKGTTYWGILGYYPGSGYISNLGNSHEEAKDLVNDLESHHWIDDFTRVLFLEFNVWNANTNLFNLVIISFEFPGSGGQITLGSIESVNLYRYAGAGGFVNLLSEVVLTIFVIGLTVMEIIGIIKHRKAYFQQFWNYATIAALVLFYVGFGFYVKRSILTTQTIEDMMNNKGKTVNFSPLVIYNKSFLMCLGTMAFIFELRLLHILRYSKTIAILGTIITSSAADLLNVALCFGIVCVAFISVFYSVFGYIVYGFRSVLSGLVTLILASVGDFDFETMQQSGGYLGIVMFLMYLLLSIYFWMNVLISVINEYIAEVQQDENKQPNDHEVIDHLLSGFRPSERSSTKKATYNIEAKKEDSLNYLSSVNDHFKESPVMTGLDQLLEDFFIWSSVKEVKTYEPLLDESNSSLPSQHDIDCDEVSLYSNLEELVILSLHMLSEDQKLEESQGDGQ